MTAIISSGREAWLKERQSLIGASDVPAILGCDERKGPLAVYLEKVGEVDSDDHDWMAFGRDVEGAIAKGYERKTQRPVADLGAHTIQRHPDLSFLGATLDRSTAGSARLPSPAPGQGPLECKAVGFQKRQQWEADPPLPFVVQVQIQMACTGSQWGSLCALIGGLTLAWKDMLRDDDFLASAYPILDEFWLRVQRREPPPADGLPATSAAVRRMWSDADGTTIALDDPAILELVTRWERAKDTKNGAEREADALENELRARLGAASFAALPDGSFLTLKVTKRDGYIVKPCEFRTLRRWHPKGARRPA